MWQWAGAVRAFARMPTLATMRQSRRWVTADVGHPPSDKSCYVESEAQKGRIVNLDGRVFWQQACGDTDRVYSDLCLKWDVILNGPGVQGPFPGSIEKLRSDKRSERKITDIRRFAEDVKDGDIVVLRLGTSKVLGIGEIVGKYEWHDAFGDIDGWDLQHVRRARWLWRPTQGPKEFSTYAMKQGDTTQKLDDGPVKKWVVEQLLDVPDSPRQVFPIPSQLDDKEIGISEISEFLFDHGVASTSITNLVNEIGELTRIAKWYQKSGMPSEHETVAYLVVPLLRALGWTPQRMAVEWNHVDLALFSSVPRSDSSLRVVVEAKKMDNSCLSAHSQATFYAQGKRDCERLIVTDGLRYGVFVRCGEDKFDLHAYMNLTRLRRNYSVYAAGGAEEALLAMAPEWKPEKASE